MPRHPGGSPARRDPYDPAYTDHAEDEDRDIPRAPPLDEGPIYTGEWREETTTDKPIRVNPGTSQLVALLTLRRPWPLVGFSVDGTKIHGGQTLTVTLRILTRGMGAIVQAASMNLVGPQLFPFASLGHQVGARCELVALLAGGGVFVPVRASLWGSNVPGQGP